MTEIFFRTQSGYKVTWVPEKTDMGKQAAESVVGSVPQFPVEVTADQAEAIREEYWALLDQQTSGGSA
jgi:hypothetical protein